MSAPQNTGATKVTGTEKSAQALRSLGGEQVLVSSMV
jgi:hypothetical protein